ncbi:HAUS augmin-like complex subunit 3 isoform 1-T2 [Anomaloglossus baeobatrachus]|uniref:HAUS augmin-like complex subunit 3 n=1 Tax=Anomaloglossus baeobatrachus TaxID=238106 RepID=UPI003F509C0A
MNCGNRFVQTLSKLSYPKASKLDGEDFDWLFETTDAKSFLDWFCASVTEQNVVSEEKLQAFNELKESGKALLDEKALEEVMKTCKPSSSKVSVLEEVAVEKLEEELSTLQKLRGLHLKRRNKLQMMASANIHSSLKLKDVEDEGAKALNEILSDLQVTSNKMNRELQMLVDGIQRLVSFYFPNETDPTSSSPPPIFLFQVLLDKYLSCEKQSTTALAQFVKEHFFEGLSKCIGGTDEDFELIQLDGDSRGDPALEEKCKEMMRLQLAYFSARQKLVEMKAKQSSLKAGLQWVEANASVAQSKVSLKDKLAMRISSLKDETSKIESHLESIKKKPLPALVQERAQMLNMPLVKGDYDTQMACLRLCTSRQEVVCDHLMKQRASFELLHLGYELELRKQKTVNRQLETIIHELRQSAERVEERLMMMSDSDLLGSNKPKINIDSRDSAAHGLFEVLAGDDTQRLFRTYSGLETVAEKLSRDVQSVKDQLAASEQEQSLFVSKMESNLKTLQDYMYPHGSELMLNTPELSSNFQQLISHLEQCNQILMEVLEDLRVKRKILQSSRFDKLEKELYAYFFQNEELLKSLVQELESQAERHT